MAVVKLNADRFEQLVRDGELPLVVDFYADWCGPCRYLAPIVDALSRRYEGRIAFAKVNIDDEPDLAAAHGIRSIPAVILFDGGEPRAWSLGAKPAHSLARELGLDRYRDGDGAEGKSRERVGALRRWWRRR